MEETFAYLKEVLGIKYIPLTYAAVVDAPEAFEALEEAARLNPTGEVTLEIEGAAPVAPLMQSPENDDDNSIETHREGPQSLTSQQVITDAVPGAAKNAAAKTTGAAAGQPGQSADPTKPNSKMPTFGIDPQHDPRQTSSLEQLDKMLEGCTRCKLHKGRKKLVFGAGAPHAELMFIGEAPGEQEDVQGEPFVGPAGQLLNKMIEAMGMRREDVYIANVVKCRPPMNRNPENDEMHECAPFLKAQIRLVNPKVIVALGAFAAQTLLETDERISKLRGRVIEIPAGPGKPARKIIATYHPSYLLRNPSEKKAAWDDLKLAMKELGLKSSK